MIRTIYYSLFNSHMIYGCQIRVIKLAEKAISLINFKENNAKVSNVFAQDEILEFLDSVHYWIKNLVKNSIEKSSPASFNNVFIQTREVHQINTKGALNNLIDILQSKTSFYRTHSIRSKSAIAWSTMQYELGFNFKYCDFKTLKRDFLTVFLRPTKSKTCSFTLSLITQYIILKLRIIFLGF